MFNIVTFEWIYIYYSMIWYECCAWRRRSKQQIMNHSRTLIYQLTVIFFVCYCSMFSIPRITEFPTFGKQLFAFIFTRIIEPALDNSLEEGSLYYIFLSYYHVATRCSFVTKMEGARGSHHTLDLSVLVPFHSQSHLHRLCQLSLLNLRA
jgi:hypothetical protein